MKKSQKVIIGAILILFVAFFAGPKTARSITIEEIKSQIAVLLVKIAEIQKQLNELIKSETPTVEKSVALISPNGGEIWQNGGTYEIKWASSGYSSAEKVKIAILDDRKQTTSVGYELDVADTANSGFYSWAIPTKLGDFALYGGLYKIVVYIGEGNDKKSAISQSYFTISLPVPAYLNLVSPNGGEILQAGSPYTIKWDSLGMETYKVNITLKTFEQNYVTIASNIPNKNFYEWTVPQNLYGSGYKILIEAYNDYGTLIVQSVSNNNFTVIQKTTLLEKIKNQLASVGAMLNNLKQTIIELIRR